MGYWAGQKPQQAGPHVTKTQNDIPKYELVTFRQYALKQTVPTLTLLSGDSVGRLGMQVHALCLSLGL